MGKPKARGGKDGARKRQEEEKEQHHLVTAGDDDNDQQQQQQQALTFMQHDFGLDRRLVKAVAKMGFVYPTLVQNKCIPLALRGKDLLVGGWVGGGVSSMGVSAAPPMFFFPAGG